MFYLIGTIAAIGVFIWYLRCMSTSSSKVTVDTTPPCDHKSSACPHTTAGEPLAPVADEPAFINANGKTEVNVIAGPEEITKEDIKLLEKLFQEHNTPIVDAVSTEPKTELVSDKPKRKPRPKKKKADSWDWPKSPEAKVAEPVKPRRAKPKVDAPPVTEVKVPRKKK